MSTKPIGPRRPVAPPKAAAEKPTPGPTPAPSTKFDDLSTGAGSALRAKAAKTIDAGATPLEQFSPYPKTPEERAVCQARITRRFASVIAAAPEGARTLLADLHRSGVDDVDIFHGSHLIIQDGGALYERWQKAGAHPRTAPSSHYHDVPVQQFEMDIPGVGVALFGKTATGQTWVQVEAHTGSDLLHHGIDAAIHFTSQFAGAANKFLREHGLPAGEAEVNNIGPAGLSPHSEKEGRALSVTYVP